MVAINALAEARIGDETYRGVITKTVMDTLASLFVQDSVTASLRPAYLALGTGTAPATPYDTALGNETARYPLTQLTQAGEVTTALVNLPVSGSGITASELGVLTRDGTLLVRANVEIEKSENSILNLIWMLSIRRG